jgi:hypothetical protein
MEIMNYGAAVAAAATAAALHFYCYICFAPARAAAAVAKTNRAPTNKKINSARQLIFGRCFQLFFFVRPPRFDLAACAEQTLAACANREPKLKAMRRGHRNEKCELKMLWRDPLCLNKGCGKGQLRY